VQISELHGALPCDFGCDQSPFANGLQYAESNTYNQVEPAAREHKPLRCDHAALSHDCLSFPRDAASGQTSEDLDNDLLHDQFEVLLKSCDESESDREGVLDAQAESVNQPYQVQLNGDQDINDQVTAFLEMLDEKVRQRKTTMQSTASTAFAPELDDAEDDAAAQSQEREHLRILSLKEWIKGSLELIQRVSNNRRGAIASSTYLTAALQISIALSEQINAHASDFKAGHDWAENVRICFNQTPTVNCLLVLSTTSLLWT
jgi:hypothetical protein